jgi:hypothetical protein
MTWALAVIDLPCSSHVYQVTPTPEIWATSSRRSPGVLRRPGEARSPTSPGLSSPRRIRRNVANSARLEATGSVMSPACFNLITKLGIHIIGSIRSTSSNNTPSTGGRARVADLPSRLPSVSRGESTMRNVARFGTSQGSLHDTATVMRVSCQPPGKRRSFRADPIRRRRAAALRSPLAPGSAGGSQ